MYKFGHFEFEGFFEILFGYPVFLQQLLRLNGFGRLNPLKEIFFPINSRIIGNIKLLRSLGKSSARGPKLNESFNIFISFFS